MSASSKQQPRLTAFINADRIEKYLKLHWPILSVVIVVTLGSPFLGLVMSGWRGVVVSLVIGLTTFFLSFYAGTRYERITHLF